MTRYAIVFHNCQQPALRLGWIRWVALSQMKKLRIEMAAPAGNMGKSDGKPAGKPARRAGGEHRVLLNDADNALLSELAKGFGLRRSETLRRVVRAALQVGPALSAENSQVVVDLSVQVRAVGRNLGQVLRAIHSGHAVRIEALAPVLETLHERVREVDAELSAITVAYGLKLRRAARGSDAARGSGEGAL